MRLVPRWTDINQSVNVIRPLPRGFQRVLGLRMRRNGFHECAEDANVPLTLVKHLMGVHPQPPPKIRPITVQV